MLKNVKCDLYAVNKIFGGINVKIFFEIMNYLEKNGNLFNFAGFFYLNAYFHNIGGTNFFKDIQT